MSNQPDKSLRTLTGIVVSDKMTASIVVRIDRKVKHPIYAKFVRRSTKVHVHDQENKCKVGDLVLIKECRHLSKTKNWEVLDILESAQ